MWHGGHQRALPHVWPQTLKSPGSVMSVLTLEWEEGELDEERDVEAWPELQASRAKTPNGAAPTPSRSHSFRLAVAGLTIDTTGLEAADCVGESSTPPSFWGSMVRLLGGFVVSPAAAAGQQCRSASPPESDELEDAVDLSPCSTGTPLKRRFEAAFGLEWTSAAAANQPPRVKILPRAPSRRHKERPQPPQQQEKEQEQACRAADRSIRSWSSDASGDQSASGASCASPAAELDAGEDEHDLNLKDAAWFLEVLEAANERELEPAALAALQQSGLRSKTKHRDAVLFHEDARFVQRQHAFRLDYSDAKCKKDPCKWLVHNLSQAVLAAYPETLRAKPDRSCVWSALLERAEYHMRKSGFTDVRVGFSEGTSRELTFYVGDYAISRSNFTKILKRYADADETKLSLT